MIRRLLRGADEEFLVAVGALEALDERRRSALGIVHIRQDPADTPNKRLDALVDKQILVAGTGLDGIDSREDSTVGQVAVELELHVAGALELLEDDLVHLGPGVDQRGCQDGERAAVLDVAGGTQKALGRVQRRGVHAAGYILYRILYKE